jgi:protein-arginine kinase activator protein McsA
MAKVLTGRYNELLACDDCASAHVENRGSDPNAWLSIGAKDLNPGETCANCKKDLSSDLSDAQAGDQSDNAAAAQALSQTIQAPPDRGRDSNRAGVKCLGCGSGAQGFDQHGPICVNCDEDYRQYGQ